jgi:hypothetical protein
MGGDQRPLAPLLFEIHFYFAFAISPLGPSWVVRRPTSRDFVAKFIIIASRDGKPTDSQTFFAA